MKVEKLPEPVYPYWTFNDFAKRYSERCCYPLCYLPGEYKSDETVSDTETLWSYICDLYECIKGGVYFHLRKPDTEWITNEDGEKQEKFVMGPEGCMVWTVTFEDGKERKIHLWNSMGAMDIDARMEVNDWDDHVQFFTIADTNEIVDREGIRMYRPCYEKREIPECDGFMTMEEALEQINELSK